MNPQMVGFALIGLFTVALILAAHRGHKVPLPVVVVLILAGSVVVLAPTAFSFALQLFDKRPQFTEDERITCWILGGVMTLVGIVAAIVQPKERRDLRS